MANTTIQILRSYANTTPTTLNDGEMAYSFVSNTMFIGDKDGRVIAVGGANNIILGGINNYLNSAELDGGIF
jgi:hypothetical protein